jgi:hypothetical protein
MKLSALSLNWALAHVERFGDTDIFPKPFEFEAIRWDWGQLLPELTEIDLLDYPTRPFRRTLTPKSRYGFRVATQLDPLDSLLFAALVYEIAKDLEQFRIPAKSQIVMSHRIKRSKDGQLYDPSYNFDSFKDLLRVKSEARPDGWVATTDISDFYNRLYHHPLENALKAATKKNDHVAAIMRLLGQWNFSVSYGVPVGPAATRILAEVAISDVDYALIDEGIDFCRFSDDYRIFAPTEKDAFRALAVLAKYLHENHGLTLSERKTDILQVSRFVDRHIEGTRPGDSVRLADQVAKILEKHGHEEDLYALLTVEELSDDLVRELDELDLNTVLQDQMHVGRMVDAFAVSIALRRLAQLEDATLLDLVVENIHQLPTVLPQVVHFIAKVTPESRRSEIGALLIDRIASGASGHEEYERSWLLSLFLEDASWGNRNLLVKLLTSILDDISRPTLLQALGVASHPSWFRSTRREVQNMGGWQRRSFIRGAMCMEADEYTHWVRSLLTRLDLLDQAIARFCLATLR